MSGRPFEESQKIRELIKAALEDGATGPARVVNWIEQRANEDFDVPSIATVGRIMREELGYSPTGSRWEKSKKKGT
jgi:hypothetical protein